MNRTEPLLFKSKKEIQTWRAELKGTVGFVPTMGALHEGHLGLLRKLRPLCDHLVLSIFVNPTQFSPEEDLDQYPRTFQADEEKAKTVGTDAIFYPSVEEVYPHGFSTYVEETELSKNLCGAARPGHFRGVTTVVLKLFQIVQPHRAFFGLKDAQQFFILHKMSQDLDLTVSVEGVGTIREEDGLAMSSRNAYLSEAERTKAPLFFQILKELEAKLSSGKRIQVALNEAKEKLTQNGFQVQYLEAIKLPLFQPIQESSNQDSNQSSLIAGAVFLGKTRLIDNVILNSAALSKSKIQLHLS
jgi:pantoate--beta-alanine ligase